MIKFYILFSLSVLFSAKVLAADQEVVEPEFREPITPIIIGVALITWGVYELGDDVKSSQRNVQFLWGGALAVSAGLVLYQSSIDKGSRIVVTPAYQGGASIAYSYRF